MQDDPQQKPVAKKDRPILVPLDEQLRSDFEAKAKARGWPLTSIIRALMRLWVDEDVLSPEDVSAEQKTAPKGGDRRSAKAKGKGKRKKQP